LRAIFPLSQNSFKLVNSIRLNCKLTFPEQESPENSRAREKTVKGGILILKKCKTRKIKCINLQL